ncbi:MAG: serine protease [bacterium]|nr:serine protease [bacterium]
MFGNAGRIGFVIFITVFAGAWPGQAQEKEVLHPKHLEQEAEKSTAPSGANKIPTFLSMDGYLPDPVNNLRKDSIVPIRVEIIHYGEDEGGMHHDTFSGVGFVPPGWDGYVLTCMHVLGPAYPAIWSDKDFPLTIQVTDGKNIFDAELASFSYEADLVLLKVVSPNVDKVVFGSKPATMPSETLSKSPLAEKLYAFSFFPANPSAFFSIQIGPLRAMTNLLSSGMVYPMGIVQGGVEKGFSGGPLITPDGVVVGVVARTTASYSYVILVETISRFLDSAKTGMKKAEKSEKK